MKPFEILIQDLPEILIPVLQETRQRIDKPNDYLVCTQALKIITSELIKDDSELQKIKDQLTEDEFIETLRITLRILKFSTGMKDCIVLTHNFNDPVINLYRAEVKFHPGELEKTHNYVTKEWRQLLKLKKQGESFNFADEMDFLLYFVHLAGNRHKLSELLKIEQKVQNFFEIADYKNPLVKFYKGLFYATLSFWIREMGKTERAEQYNEIAEDFAKEINHPFLMGWIANNHGALEITKGNFLKALNHFQQALELWQSVGNVEGMAFTFNNIGVIKNSMGHYKEAREAYIRSKELHLKASGRIYRTIIFSNIASTFRAENKFQEALKTIEEGLVIEQQNTKPTLDLLYLLSEKIEILLEMEEIKKAKQSLLLLKKQIETLDASPFESQYYYFTGLIKSLEMNFGLAKEDLFKAVELSSQSPDTFRTLLKAEIQLAKVLITSFRYTRDQNDLDLAFSFMENLIKACKEQNLLPFYFDLLIIRSFLYLLNNQYEKSIEDLKEVLENAKKNGLTSQHNRAKEQLAKMMASDQTFSEKRKVSELLDYLEESASSLLSFDIYVPPKEVNTNFYGILVSTKGGIPVYSKMFENEMINDDVLISGLISAVSSFTQELVRKGNIGSLKSISHEEIIILIENIDRNLFVTLFVENDTHESRLQIIQIARKIKQALREKGFVFEEDYSEKDSQLPKLIESIIVSQLPQME